MTDRKTSFKSFQKYLSKSSQSPDFLQITCSVFFCGKCIMLFFPCFFATEVPLWQKNILSNMLISLLTRIPCKWSEKVKSIFVGNWHNVNTRCHFGNDTNLPGCISSGGKLTDNSPAQPLSILINSSLTHLQKVERSE